MQDIKSFFHSWCNKQKKFPSFDVRLAGTKQKQRFLCEVRVEGFPYTGCGNSTTKKNAQFNAARDFVQYLVREKIISATEVPTETVNKDVSAEESNQCSSQSNESTQRKSVFQHGMQPDVMGEAYRPYSEGGVDSSYTYIDRIADQKNLQDAEEIDVNSAIHGNWTIENGKSRLHQFLQKRKIKADYKYSQIGSEGCKSFVAEMAIYIKELNRILRARESASNKASASKSCALSLVRQLYHLGVIEAFSGTLKTRDKNLEVKSYPVAIAPELEIEINDVLETLNIVPASIPESENSEQGVSIISSTVLEEFISMKPAPAGVVSWAPPVENWNAWTGCNIDEGPLAEAKLDDISEELEQNLRQKLQGDLNLQKKMEERRQLPVFAKKNEIMEIINENPVTIIRGNTGCGKTTQVCQFILDDYIQSGQGAYCNIVVTQPRRISAVSLSDRIAFERGENLGDSVGYSVRFESCLPRPFGGILFCTVGVLLKRLENGLRGVSHVIVDEIHERDANTDFILVILRDMIYTYPELRLILMSATVDTTLFRDYFGNCPVVEIPGQTYPVKEYFLEDCIQMLNFVPSAQPRKRKAKKRYKAEDEEEDEEDDDDDDAPATQVEDEEDYCNAIVGNSYTPETIEAMKKMREKEISFELIEALLEHIKTLDVPGAVLIFLPGWNLIMAFMKHLQQHPIFGSSDYVILPLHSQLPREDQRRVFQIFPSHITKVILATNIAETSITINDVVFVIDSCQAKMKFYTSHNNMTHYATVWAAKTNLEQRKGRAGRVRPGICYHLCSNARYQRLEEHLTPEMLKTPLHELALAIKMLRLGSIGQFLSKAVEPPPIDAVIEAEVLLRELKCLDSNDEITPLGKILGRLPVEPRLGKMMVLGCIFYCGDALTTIAASSSTFAEVFVQPLERRRLTFKQKSFSGSRFSDHVAMLNAFQAWNDKRMISPSAEENFCESKMLSLPTLKVTWEAKNQLIQLMTGVSGFPEETMVKENFDYIGPDPKLDLVIGLLTSGLYPNVAYHQSKRKVVTISNVIAVIHKSSVNCTNLEQTFPIPFFVFGEKVRSKTVTCKHMTMVTPIHLLLFGARKVEFVNNAIKLDGWITLDIKPQLAAAIVALRPALESLIIKASKDPEDIIHPSETDQKVIDVVRKLCELNAGRHGMNPIDSRGFSIPPNDNFSGYNEPPFKRSRFWNNRNATQGEYNSHFYGGGYRSGNNRFGNVYSGSSNFRRGPGHFRGGFRGRWGRGGGGNHN